MQVDKKIRYDLRIIIILAVILFVFASSDLAVVGKISLKSVPTSTEVECQQLDFTTLDLVTVACNKTTDNSLLRRKSPYMTVFFFEPIPINQASFTLLQTVKGVGPKLAQKIVDHKEQFGSFSDKESLEILAGVGEKRARYLATQFTFE